MSVIGLRLIGALSSDKLEDVEGNINNSIDKVVNPKDATNTNSNDANDEVEEDWYSLSKDELIERLVDMANDYVEAVDKHTDLLNKYESLLNNYENLLNKHDSLVNEHELLLAAYDVKCEQYDELVEEYEY